MRYLMDTLRMLAYHAELDLARQLAPHLSKPETPYDVVRHTLFASGNAHRPGWRSPCERQVGAAAHSPGTDTPPARSPDTRIGHLSSPRNQCPNSPPPPLSQGFLPPPAARIRTSIVSPCPELRGWDSLDRRWRY